MSKLVRIDDECETILRKYSDGSLSDCIRNMEQMLTKPVTNVTNNVTNVNLSKEDVQNILHTELASLKRGMETINNEILERLHRGGYHAHPQLGEPDYKPNTAVRMPVKESGFVKASALYNKEDLPIKQVGTSKEKGKDIGKDIGMDIDDILSEEK